MLNKEPHPYLSVLVPNEEFADKRKVFAVLHNSHLFAIGQLLRPTSHRPDSSLLFDDNKLCEKESMC